MNVLLNYVREHLILTRLYSVHVINVNIYCPLQCLFTYVYDKAIDGFIWKP